MLQVQQQIKQQKELNKILHVQHDGSDYKKSLDKK